MLATLSEQCKIKLQERTRASLKYNADRDRKRYWYKYPERQIEWIDSYKTEEKHGISLLQRLQFLKLLNFNSISKSQNGQLEKNQKPPGYTRLLEQDGRIRELEGLYGEHRRKLLDIILHKPNLRYKNLIKEHEFLQHSKNQRGQSLAWEEDRKACVFIEGCCGRSCGCCEKPQRESYMPIERKENEVEKVKVYGHCTLECVCCNLFHGRYKPDKSLPSIDTGLLERLQYNQ